MFLLHRTLQAAILSQHNRIRIRYYKYERNERNLASNQSRRGGIGDLRRWTHITFGKFLVRNICFFIGHNAYLRDENVNFDRP